MKKSELMLHAAMFDQRLLDKTCTVIVVTLLYGCQISVLSALSLDFIIYKLKRSNADIFPITLLICRTGSCIQTFGVAVDWIQWMNRPINRSSESYSVYSVLVNSYLFMQNFFRIHVPRFIDSVRELSGQPS